MRQFGLVGKSLRHSFSKVYFDEKFTCEGIPDTEYELYELPGIEELPKFLLSHPCLVGLNVTIPYKQAVIPYLDELSEEAAAVGAVNTILIQHIGNQTFTKGYNTDTIGFQRTLEGIVLPGRALVLGTGGASAAVRHVLGKSGCRCSAVSRDESRGFPYSALTPQFIRTHRLIINCTPLGTHPDVEEKPDIPYEGITEDHILYDLVYNPAETAFLKEGVLRGAKTFNGLEMLHAQADAAWRIWTQQQPG